MKEEVNEEVMKEPTAIMDADWSSCHSGAEDDPGNNAQVQPVPAQVQPVPVAEDIKDPPVTTEGARGSDPGPNKAADDRPKTVLSDVLASLDKPNQKIWQIKLNSHQRFDVPKLARVIGTMFEVIVKVRGRHGDLHVTVTAPTGDQARYVAEFLESVVNMNKGMWPDYYGDLEQITIVTCGAKRMRARPGHCQLLDVKHQLNSMLGSDGNLTFDPPVDWAIDVREFSDPENHAQTRGHVGHHPVIQKGIALNDQFLPMLQWIKHLLQDYGVNCGQRHVTLAMVCNSGRHRSVAVGILVQQCLLALGRFSVSLTHISKQDGGWEGTCMGPGPPYYCQACRWSSELCKIYDFISSIWTAI